MNRILRKTIGVILAITLVVTSIVPIFGFEAFADTGGTTASTGEEQTCEHVFGDWVTTTKATYFAAGSKTRTCELCGATETQTIAKKTAYNKWVKHNGNKYYFNGSSKPVKGWKIIKSSNKKNAKVKWCYFNNSGVFRKAVSKNTRKKWVKVDKKKFYFTAKKKPIGKGFHMIGGKLYYFGADKAMVKGKFKADDGNVYTTTKQGYITGLQYYKKRYKTFVLIDISSQNLKYYIKGKKNMSVSVVTGTPGDRATPTGVFSVQTKARNVTLTGPTWSVPVSYWMPFIDGAYGMHDASFRSESEFKNHRTYITNGSHGCVNMRFRDAKKLYGKIRVGTPVIIQP